MVLLEYKKFKHIPNNFLQNRNNSCQLQNVLKKYKIVLKKKLFLQNKIH